MGSELILEIGTEEIPARFTPTALENLTDLMRRELTALEITFGEVRALGTPRRLAVWVDDVGECQRDTVERKLGPPRHVAFDEQGEPTQAAQGFAKAQGLKVEDLEIVTTEKGDYLCAVRREQGRKGADVLREGLPRVITSLSFTKSMRWGTTSLRFVRPIRWILALLGGEVIPFRLDNVESGHVTYGHRFMSPGCFRVQTRADYVRKLRQASVIVDPEERKRMIEKGVQEAAAGVSGRILMNRELLDEVTYLVEYPVVVLGGFDSEFLKLPKDVVIHAMEDHQRYFPVMSDEGLLLPHFVCVCNTRAADMDVVKRGHERVLRARLSDARFFFNEDTKVPLERRVEELKGVVFQAKLGTSYDKVIRLRTLSRFLARRLRPEVENAADRAALLCKADLVTGVVKEFPDLQGIMGREYALLSGESEEVADAISEHYLPAFAGDRLPSSSVGDFLSMADKIDTVTGCFGVGLVPTGAGDPFALRRHALGVLNILLEKRYPVGLEEVVSESLELLRGVLERPPEEVRDAVMEFFRQRFQNLLLSRGIPQDVVEAVLAVGFDEVVGCHERMAALVEARNRNDFEDLAVAFKRVVNISRGHDVRSVDPTLFTEEAEESLHGAFVTLADRLDVLLRRQEYRQVLAELTRLKDPVDRFFDRVLVMDENAGIRNNRLALLGQIADLFARVADFSRLVTD